MSAEPPQVEFPLLVPLHRSKLAVPVIHARLIPRPALLERLDCVRTRRLAVLQAPAGHGKTVTVVKWLRRSGVPAAWVTVDAEDQRLTRLAQHVAVALDGVTPGLAARLLPLLSQPDGLTAEALGAAFADALFDLGPERDVALVLDDLQWALTTEICAFLDALVTVAPRTLHVVITTRRRPGLTLSRLRVADDLVELTGADLRFSAVESQRLLDAEAGGPLDPALAGELHHAVGGWPAAIRLLAVGLREGSTPLALATGSARETHALFEYLTEQVLARLAPEERAMLLMAAAPARFSAEALAFVVEQQGLVTPPGALARLHEQDLFRETPGGWFVFHPLFQEALRAHLADGEVEAVAGLHRQLAAWFAGRDLTGEAVTHLVAAGDIEDAAALVAARAVQAFDREDWQAVASWLAQIPEAVIFANLELLLSFAWVAYLGGRTGRVGAALTRLRAWRDLAGTTAAQRAEIDILALAAMERFETDAEDAVTQTRAAIAVMAPERRYRLGFAHLTLALALGAAGREREALQAMAEFTARESGRVDAASIRGYLGRCMVLWQMAACGQFVRTARDMQRLATSHGLPIAQGWAAVFLGNAAFELGRLDEAAEHFQRVIVAAHQLHSSAVREAFAGQCLVYQAQGQGARALSALERYRVIAQEAEHPEPLEFANSLGARLALLQGDLPAAQAWAAVALPTITMPSIRTLEHPVLTRAKVLAAAGDAGAAEALVVVYLRRARDVRYRMGLLEGLAVLALAREAQQRPVEATAALRESLVIAAPEGLTQRYVLLGAGLAPILRRLRGDPFVGRHAETLLTLLRQATRPAPLANLATAPRLTPRERDILDCLDRRLTNKEIGEELGLSPVTAKNYVARLCARLEVGNRRAAVAEARRLGLMHERGAGPSIS